VPPPLLAMGSAELDPVPASHHTFADARLITRQGFRPPRYALNWLEGRAVPCFSNRFAIMCKLLPTWVPWEHRHDYVWNHTDRFGWLELAQAPNEEQLHRERQKYLHEDGARLKNFHILPEEDRALRMMLDRCRREGIGAALMLMPESEELLACYPEPALKTLNEYLGRLGGDYGVPVLDARRWCGEDGFRDGHHLVSHGAERFTIRFGRECVEKVVGGSR
jgi:hypothetical protein